MQRAADESLESCWPNDFKIGRCTTEGVLSNKDSFAGAWSIWGEECRGCYEKARETEAAIKPLRGYMSEVPLARFTPYTVLDASALLASAKHRIHNPILAEARPTDVLRSYEYSCGSTWMGLRVR